MYEKINQHGRGMMKAIELMDRVLFTFGASAQSERLWL